MADAGMADAPPTGGNVLVVGLEAEGFARIAPFLTRRKFRVDRFPRTQPALELVSRVAFQLLLVRFPPRDVDMQTFLSAVRAPGSASRHSPLVLLASSAEASRAELFIGRGANEVLRLDQSEADVQAAVSRLVHVAPRQAARLAVRLEISLGEGVDAHLGQTVNLSASGMLIETTRRPPRGSAVRFECMVDHRPIVGFAEVMRYASPERDGITGLGLRFTSFSGDSRVRFDRHLERLRDQAAR